MNKWTDIDKEFAKLDVLVPQNKCLLTLTKSMVYHSRRHFGFIGLNGILKLYILILMSESIVSPFPNPSSLFTFLK